MHSIFELGMLVSAVLAGYHAWQSHNATFFVGALFYGFLLEQVAIIMFDLYSYPLGAYALTFLDVPFAISFGWAAIIYAGYVAGRHFELSGLGLAAFTGLFGWHIDGVMDPIATRIGLWEWFDAAGWFGVPPNNYFGWFLVAFVYTFVFAFTGRYVADGVRRLALALVVSIPVLVGLFQFWLLLTGGRFLVEVVILAAILIGAVGAVITAGPVVRQPPRILFYSMAVFPLFFGAFYLIEGVYQTAPLLSVLLVVSAGITYVLFHPPASAGGLGKVRAFGRRLFHQ